MKISTMAAYDLILHHHILPYFPSVESLSEKNIQDFIKSKKEEGLSQRSIKGIVSVVKMLLKYLRERDLISGEDFKIEMPKDYHLKEVDVFTVAHQQTLLQHITSNLSLKNLGILICLNSGLRIGEICALKWRDIDLRKGVLNVNKTVYRLYLGKEAERKTELMVSPPKTLHSNRFIPLPDYLIEIVRKFGLNKNEENYILSDSMMPMEPRNYRNYYRQLLQKLNLPELKFHSLRHSFATRCIESGCDYKTVSALLGHSDISTTLNLYVHPSFDQKKRCIEKMLKSIND